MERVVVEVEKKGGGGEGKMMCLCVVVRCLCWWSCSCESASVVEATTQTGASLGCRSCDHRDNQPVRHEFAQLCNK